MEHVGQSPRGTVPTGDISGAVSQRQGHSCGAALTPVTSDQTGSPGSETGGGMKTGTFTAEERRAPGS